VSELATIEQYLDQLADRLLVSPRRARRILTEVQDHLYTSRQSLIDGGMALEEAEVTALKQFGSPAAVARDFRRQTPLSWIPFLEAVATPLAGLAAIGLIAIGLSGLLALGLGLVAGKEFVAGDAPGVTYTPSRCEEYLRLYPSAEDCTAAALADHFDEVVGFRIAAGILGLMAGAAYFGARRLRRPAPMPPAFAPTLAVAAFAPVGIALAGLGMMQTLTGGGGGGENIAGGLVALVFAASFSLRLLPVLATETSA
jgi:HAAS